MMNNIVFWQATQATSLSWRPSQTWWPWRWRATRIFWSSAATAFGTRSAWMKPPSSCSSTYTTRVNALSYSSMLIRQHLEIAFSPFFLTQHFRSRGRKNVEEDPLIDPNSKTAFGSIESIYPAAMFFSVSIVPLGEEEMVIGAISSPQAPGCEGPQHRQVKQICPWKTYGAFSFKTDTMCWSFFHRFVIELVMEDVSRSLGVPLDDSFHGRARVIKRMVRRLHGKFSLGPYTQFSRAPLLLIPHFRTVTTTVVPSIDHLLQ